MTYTQADMELAYIISGHKNAIAANLIHAHVQAEVEKACALLQRQLNLYEDFMKGTSRNMLEAVRTLNKQEPK